MEFQDRSPPTPDSYLAELAMLMTARERSPSDAARLARVPDGELSSDGHPMVERTRTLLVAGPRRVEVRLLRRGVLRIGRAQENEVSVDDPELSEVHALLYVGDLLEIEDLGTNSGTWLGPERLRSAERHPLETNQAVRVGATIILVQSGVRRLETGRASAPEVLEHRLREELAASRGGASVFSLLRLRLSRAVPDWVLAHVLEQVPHQPGPFARHGPCEYDLLLPDTPEDRAQTLAVVLAAELAPLGLGVTHSTVTHPVHGSTVDALKTQLRSGALGVRRPSPVIAAPAMHALYGVVDRIAPSTISVLLIGETGVGKEVVAEAIHAASPRAARSFVRLNCAALSTALLESELFGHERGAFTGAERQKLGLLEAAEGGTVLLDEIGELAPETQARLLRALERKEIIRVGGVRPIPIDVRFVSATNRQLERDIETGRFREDLYFRLNGIRLSVPPLRERREEITPLALHFVRQMAADLDLDPPDISLEAMSALERHGWRGNIRELKNVMQRAVLLCDGARIEPEDLAIEEERIVDDLATTLTDLEPSVPIEAAPLEAADSAPAVPPSALLEVLRETAGNQTRAAKRLGVSRQTLGKWMKRYGLPRPGRS